MTELPSGLVDLLAEQGVDRIPVHGVLGVLADGGWWTPRELVRATAAPHRLVASTLAALGADAERDGDRHRLLRPADYAHLRPREPADPLADLVAAHPDAAAELRRLVDDAPRADHDLDHITATAHTILRRGVYLATRFTLPGARLLCVGDHDLTSLAATLVCPEARATVVDVDERVLEYVDGAADRLGLDVRCHFADLRLGLPAPLHGHADLVFTDPPYTPDGVELFVRRGMEGLADPGVGRLLLAYGASAATPTLVAKTQARLSGMGLVSEVIWPDFNRYLGAEAIGAASDLYVLRPTSRAQPGGRAGPPARIYSRGARATETARAAGDTGGLDAPAARAVLQRAEEHAGTPVDTVVGDWPDPSRTPEAPGPEPRRVRLARWLAGPVPARRAAINLAGGWEVQLARVILASPAEETRVIVPSSTATVRDEAGQGTLRSMVAPRFDVRFLRGHPEPRSTVVVAREVPAGDGDHLPAVRLLRHCQARAHGVVANTLREGLIDTAAGLGHSLTKRDARSRVAAAAPWLTGHTLLDLPQHRVGELGTLAERLVAEVV